MLEALYAAFGLGWEADPCAGVTSRPGPTLAEEAIWIARDLEQLRPDEP